jgi:hypothetical protein
MGPDTSSRLFLKPTYSKADPRKNFFGFIFWVNLNQEHPRTTVCHPGTGYVLIVFPWYSDYISTIFPWYSHVFLFICPYFFLPKISRWVLHHAQDRAQSFGLWGIAGFIGSCLGPLVAGGVLWLFPGASRAMWRMGRMGGWGVEDGDPKICSK